MIELIVFSILIFTSVVLVTLGVGPHIAKFRDDVSRAYLTEQLASQSAPALLRSFYPLLKVLGQYNKGLDLRKRKLKYEKLLEQAGAPNEIGADEFLGIAELCAAAVLIFSILLLKGVLGMSIWFCLAISVGGFFLPGLWLASYVGSRLVAVHRQLPYMLDLLVMAMEAGSSFLEALGIYIQDNRQEPLAEEFSLFLSEINLGKTRREALSNLADRVGSDEVRSFALALIQGEEMGTPLGALLRIYSDGMRLKRTQSAEKLAGEAAVKILGPSMLMMIAVVLLVLGPIIVKYTRGEMII
jgi:tight adherence protein C